LRALLLIAHDSLRFIAGFDYDFVSSTPIQFRKLRNIVLACRPFEPVPLLSRVLTVPNATYDGFLNSPFLTIDSIAQVFLWSRNERELNGRRSWSVFDLCFQGESQGRIWWTRHC
jgi:hypothetical protein